MHALALMIVSVVPMANEGDGRGNIAKYFYAMPRKSGHRIFPVLPSEATVCLLNKRVVLMFLF